LASDEGREAFGEVGSARERRERGWCGAKKREGRGPAGPSAWREKEGEKGGAGMAVGSVGWLAAAPGRWVQVVQLPNEQGRAAGVGYAGEGTRAADARDWGEAGPGVSGGVRGRAKR
jgi:hypothetical protein